MAIATLRADSLSPWQASAMAVPEEFDLALTGGRGGGKTRLLAALFLRHAEQHGARARCLVVRRSFPGLQDLEAEFIAFFHEVYGGRAKYDGQKHQFRLPNGATIQLDQLEREADYLKYQGKSFTYIAVDEAGQWPDARLVDRLRGSLRGPEGVPTRFIVLANPGGAGHAWVAKRHALRAPWQPYTDAATEAQFVTIASTYRDNPFIDGVKYAQNLRAACAVDPELAKAWLDGDWSVIRGAFFASVLDEHRVMIEPWASLPSEPVRRRCDGSPWDDARDEWRTYLAHDFGSAAPSVTYVVAESPGSSGPDGRFYPRGSILLLDEFASALPDEPNRGLGLTVPELAHQIKELCSAWSIPAQGVADDAIFSKHGHAAGSISAEFRCCGVYFRPARKGSRLSGWEKMRRLLADAGKPDAPGLYVSRLCRYWWQTVPALPRDPRRVEDVDSTAPDHAADACRYALTANTDTIPNSVIKMF